MARKKKTLEIISGTGLWYRAGTPPTLLRWVLVRDPDGKMEPQAFFCTDTDMDPADIISNFAKRWEMEVTFQEVRTHLGVETQRQWSKKAIARTTPALLGLYSLVCLWAQQALESNRMSYAAAWYKKTNCNCSPPLRGSIMMLDQVSGISVFRDLDCSDVHEIVRMIEGNTS